MKTIEEKAKAYDEIIERAKTMLAASEVMYGKENNASQLITDLIPELRESEDERMMREFNDWLCEEIECRTNDLRDEKDRRTLNMLCYVLTKVKEWLEKQKEQKPEGVYVNCTEHPEWYGMPPKEQKPIEFKNDELVEIIKGEFEGFRRLLKKKGIDYEPQYGYWEGFARLFDSSAREYVKEQEPVEWSEKDKNIFNLAFDLIKHSDDCDGILDRELAVKWFAELPSRFVLQPKQEWNEKDKLNTCPHYSDGYGCDISPMKECESCEHRPSWKPSEEQINTIGLAIQVLNSSGHNSLCCKLNALRDDLLKLK